MGYAYDDWVGPLFPRGLARSQWLSFYAQHHDSIEMNTTFHAVPTPERVRAWRDAVPADFRFSVKVNKRITHELALSDAVGEMKAFIDVARHFEDKLGPLLLQFPPVLPSRAMPGLQKLLASLPRDLQFAIEFRDRSWLRKETYELLSSHNIAMVMLDHEDHPWARDLPATADFLYLRLVGKHGRYEDIGYEKWDPTEELIRWKNRIELRAKERAINEVWVLFNNDYAGHAPATLRRFAKIVDAKSIANIAPPTLFD